MKEGSVRWGQWKHRWNRNVKHEWGEEKNGKNWWEIEKRMWQKNSWSRKGKVKKKIFFMIKINEKSKEERKVNLSSHLVKKSIQSKI